MEAQNQKRKRVVNTTYTKWTEAEKHKLIDERIKFDHLFTGKNANQRDGWIKIGKELHKSPQLCRNQWQSLARKYKAISDGHSGDGANDDGPACDPSTWPYFDKIHSYAAHKHNYHPEMFLSNLEGQHHADGIRKQVTVQNPLPPRWIRPSFPMTYPVHPGRHHAPVLLPQTKRS